MANEAQYYSPIIQAYLQATARQQQAGQFQQEQDLRQQEAAQRQKEQDALLKQAQQKIENEHDYQQQVLDIQHQARQLATQQAKETTFEHLRNIIANGVSPQAAAAGIGGTYSPGTQTQGPPQEGLPAAQNPMVPTGAPGIPDQPETITSAAGDQIPVAGLPNQSQTIEAEMNALRQKYQAQEDVQEPGKIRAQAAAAEATGQQRLEEIKQTGLNQAALQDAENRRAHDTAVTNGSYHLRGIALLHNLGLEGGDGAVSQRAKQLSDAIWNGSVPFASLSKDDKNLVTNYGSANGEIPPAGKDYGKTLDAVAQMDQLLNEYQDLAQNYSKDSANNTWAQRMEKGQLGGLVPTSTLNAKQNGLKASAGLLAKGLEQQSRTSDANIVRQQLGNFDPTASTASNLANIQGHRDQLNQMVRNLFPTASPERINTILQNRGIKNLSVGNQQPQPENNQKVTTKQHIADYAKQNNLTIDQATTQAQSEGYTIQ